MLSSAMILAGTLLSSPSSEPVQPMRVVADESGRIEVVARGMRNDEGRMLAMIYDSDEGFPKDLDACKDYRTASISNGRARTSFSGLEPGVYAVLVIHDEDRNGYLKTNLIGMPKEGVGVSGNGTGFPKFKKAKFELAGGATVSKSIEIRYLL